MPLFSDYPVATLKDVVRFETEKTLEQRYDARSIYGHLRKERRAPPRSHRADHADDRRDDEDAASCHLPADARRHHPRGEFLCKSRRARGRASPTSSQVWSRRISRYGGAETAGYAVPLNFLLQAQNIADLVRASGAKILVALGPASATRHLGEGRHGRQAAA